MKIATIKSSQIKDCIDLLNEDESISTVAPVIQNNDHHPFRAKRIREDGFIDPCTLAGHQIASNRQQLEPNYFLCHSFYVLRVKNCFKKDGQPPWNFMGNRVKPYKVEYSLDVHSEEDIFMTEKWLTRGNIMVSIENFDNKFRKIGNSEEWKTLQKVYNDCTHVFLFGHGGNMAVADHAIDMTRLTDKNVIASPQWYIKYFYYIR